VRGLDLHLRVQRRASVHLHDDWRRWFVLVVLPRDRLNGDTN
jgi:hypothetical protein